MREMLGFSQEDIIHVLQEHVRQNRQWPSSKVSFDFFQGDKQVTGIRVAAVVERTVPKGIDPLE